MKVLLVFAIFIVVVGFTSAREVNEREMNSEREDKFFSIFTIVRFPNDACRASSGDNGTCFTSNECSSSGGTSSGTCASGFGVCCVFTGTCNGETNKNCTYFENPGTSLNEATSCTFRVNKCSDNICQLRLDFENFVIEQPADGTTNTETGQCNVDTFRITGGPSGAFGPICGTMTDQHVYYDIGRGTGTCTLSFSTTTDTFDRTWKIKISQIPCCSELMAPPGCDQYYTGTSGMIQSYNWLSSGTAATGIHLADQKQIICVRPEAGFCSIKYQVDSTIPSSSFLTQTGTAGQSVAENDCIDYVLIPCGQGMTTGTSDDAYCGERLRAGAADAANEIVEASARFFQVVFISDGSETTADAGGAGLRGFKLLYTQQPC